MGRKEDMKRLSNERHERRYLSNTLKRLDKRVKGEFQESKIEVRVSLLKRLMQASKKWLKMSSKKK